MKRPPFRVWIQAIDDQGRDRCGDSYEAVMSDLTTVAGYRRRVAKWLWPKDVVRVEIRTCHDFTSNYKVLDTLLILSDG